MHYTKINLIYNNYKLQSIAYYLLTEAMIIREFATMDLFL
jgi:hypothetical protein